jgi:CheY-like chemotaxis protein
MSRRILLADDSVTIQKVIELTFMDDDYEVRAVGNGDEALAMLTALEVDFVIADVHMPGASGYEVCRRAKQLRPAVPVLLLVGTFEPFDESQARECGADSYLKKPFDSQELLGRVHELLGAQPRPQEAAATEPAAAPPAATPPAPAPPAAVGAATGAPAAAGAAAAGAGSPDIPATPATPPPAPPTPAPPQSPQPFEAAASWQELEIEAEPELIPEPWQPPRTPPVTSSAAPPAEPRYEQAFALGDLEEPEQGLQGAPASGVPGAAAPPAASAGAGDTGGAATVPGAPLFERPFSLGEPLDDNAFLIEEAEDELLQPALRTTAAEPVSPFRTGGATGAAEVAAGTTSASPAPETPASSAAHPISAAAPPAPPDTDALLGSLEQAEQRAAGAAAGLPAFAAAAGAPGNGQPQEAPPAPIGSAVAAALRDEDVDRIARRVVELIGDRVVRDIAWEVIPDLAEVVIKDRLRELESQIE